MHWWYLVVAMACEGLIVGIIVAKHAYVCGFRHGWISGADKTIDVTRRHGLWLAEYMLDGMKRMYGSTTTPGAKKYPE